MFKKSLAGACAALCLSPAVAAADVTLEVAGSQKPLLAQTTTTTGGAAVAKDGSHACAGSSVAGALDRTTAGDWAGTYSAAFGSYTVDAIKGEAHPFSGGDYWSLYVNGKISQTGACETTLQDGDRVQWLPACAGNSSGCYTDPLQLSAPATVKPGTAFAVTVTQTTTTTDADYNQTSVVGPADGASIGGTSTGADGKATLTLTSRGPQTLVATKGRLAPSSAVVCVTDGADGFCGTTAAGAAPAPAPASPAPAPAYDGPVAGKITAVSEQQRFARGKAPRTLSGTVAIPPAGLKDVALRLTRTVGGKCSQYDAKRERFVAMKRCGSSRASYFSIGDRANWSYLLPSALTKGRYVLDVRATDATGKSDTTLQRGRNRIVFTVS